MRYVLEVENIKCGGCAHIIERKILKKHDVTEINIDIENGSVAFKSVEDISSDVAATLKSLGYPESGSVEGIADIKAKATSFVSCAIGKMQKN